MGIYLPPETGNVRFDPPEVLVSLSKRKILQEKPFLHVEEIFEAKLADGAILRYKTQMPTNKAVVEAKKGITIFKGFNEIDLKGGYNGKYSLWGCNGCVDVQNNSTKYASDRVETHHRKIDNELTQRSKIFMLVDSNDTINVTHQDVIVP